MKRRAKSGLLMILAGLLISACGAGQSPATSTPEPPTRTPFPTFAFIEPTTAPVFEQQEDSPASDDSAGGAVDAVQLDPTKVARGLGRYEALNCTSCHGESGVGTDRAKHLTDFSLSEEDFITFLRSGGELGTRHQFSTDRLSDSGSRNLYQYLVSIAAGS